MSNVFIPGWFIGYLYPLDLVISMKKKLKNHLFSTILIESKKLLYIINKITSIGSFKRSYTHLYIYKHIKIIILMCVIILDEEIW